MAESEGEIEYLDEDAEVVQHCVQLTQPQPSQLMRPVVQELIQPLLVELPTVQKRKRRIEEDSEYDPSDDNQPPSPPSPPMRRKKATTKRLKTQPKPTALQNNKGIKVEKVKENSFSPQAEFLSRKKLNIRIPDYDDPLCLPVRAIKSMESDVKRLNNWNNVCLEHFKHCDMLLKPERGETKKSVRTAVFRNVVNNQTGNAETTIWSKTCVGNEDGDKKSEIFQCVLPRYKEKQLLGNYLLSNQKLRPFHTVNEVVLSKEEHKDGEALVVYKPKESLSAVYALIDKRKSIEESVSTENDSNMYLKELASCKVCASCFHTSCRGLKQAKSKSLVCPICARTYVTIYNLLAHFKGHSPGEVQRYKRIISRMLADIVSYHYKCRICRKQFESIKSLRKHLPEHQSTDVFKCEVCNRVINKK